SCSFCVFNRRVRTSDCCRIPFKLFVYSLPPERAAFISERNPRRSRLKPSMDLFAPSSSQDNLVLKVPISLATYHHLPFLPNITKVNFFLLRLIFRFESH